MAQQLFIDLAAHPQAILDAMDEMRVAIARIERQRKWITVINILRVLIIVGAVLLLFLGNGLVALFELRGNGLVALVLLGLTISSYFLYRPKHIPAKERFEAAYQVIHTLRDDAGRKGRLIGHLDLSPPNQKNKLFRTARSSTGKRKYYYRDPWFVVKLKLVDGNVVRLQMEERIKEKKGSIVARVTRFEDKVIINPDVYEAVDRYDPSTQLVTTGSGPLDSKQLNVQDMLENLRGIYTQLRPAATQTASPPPTSGAASAETQPPETPGVSNPGIPPEGQPL